MVLEEDKMSQGDVGNLKVPHSDIIPSDQPSKFLLKFQTKLFHLLNLLNLTV